MSLDLGSPVLDVAFGLSFVFFLLSIISSTIGEAFARFKGTRSKMLEKGLKGMLGDGAGKADLATKVWEHPLVQSDVNSAPGKKDPSYVSGRNFALALTQSLKEAEAGVQGTVHYGAAAVRQIEDSFEKIDPNLRKQLEPIWHEVDKDIDQFRSRAEKWFDDTMDRVSGWYKRWSQVVTLVIALFVAVGLNASALRITDRLYNDEAVRTAAVSGAEGTVQNGKAPEANGKEAEAAIANLETLNLPIFWAKDNLPTNSPQAAIESVVGWLITAIAISLGAPFWFDALGKISRVRAAGKRPEDEPAPKPS
jgi:hypothetical protein